MIRVELPDKISTNPYYRLHYRARAPLHEVFYYAAQEGVDDADIEITPFPVDVEYIFYLRGKLLDAMNLSAMAKMIEDGLVHAGLMKDDSKKWVNSVKLQCERLPKGDDPHCIINFYQVTK